MIAEKPNRITPMLSLADQVYAFNKQQNISKIKSLETDKMPEK